MANFEVDSFIPSSPLEVVLPFAYDLTFKKEFDDFKHHKVETDAVWEMNIALKSLGLISEYEVDTQLAFILPVDIEPDDEGNVSLHRMDERTMFNADLIGVRTLKIGKKLGEQSIRSVCLFFDNALIRYRTTVERAVIPVLNVVDKEDRVYIPVFAVNEIAQAA